MDDEERRNLIRAEINITIERKERAATMHFTTLYAELVAREAALRWCLGIEEVTMIELRR